MGVNKKIVYIIAVTIACCSALLVFNIVYVGHVSKVNNQKWCTLVVTLDDNYKSNPPVTDLGTTIAGSFKDLRNEFGC